MNLLYQILDKLTDINTIINLALAGIIGYMIASSHKFVADWLTDIRKKIEIERKFASCYRLMPDLLNSMANNLEESPCIREFIIKGEHHVYNHPQFVKIFQYFYEDHTDLEGKLTILKNHEMIKDITYNSVSRYEFKETFVKFLNQKKNPSNFKKVRDYILRI